MDLQAQARAHRLGQTRAVMIYRRAHDSAVPSPVPFAASPSLACTHVGHLVDQACTCTSLTNPCVPSLLFLQRSTVRVLFGRALPT